MLNSEQKSLLEFIMKYVNDAHKHTIDKVAIEQSLQDIINACEELAIGIEEGKWERESYE